VSDYFRQSIDICKLLVYNRDVESALGRGGEVLILNEHEGSEVKGYLKACGLSIQELARLLDRNRTTINKKITGDLNASPCDFIDMGRMIERERAASADQGA
jgi:AraC-like DNA-binding protein